MGRLSRSLGKLGEPPQKHGQTCSDTTFWLSGPVCPQFLPKNLHLVCVDMPGHEGTTRSSLDDLSIDGQVKRIHQVSREAPPKNCPGGSCPPLHPQVWRTVNTGSVSTHNCKQNGSSPVVSSVSCRGPGVIADFFKRIITVSGEIQSHFLNSSKREFRIPQDRLFF